MTEWELSFSEEIVYRENILSLDKVMDFVLVGRNCELDSHGHAAVLSELQSIALSARSLCYVYGRALLFARLLSIKSSSTIFNP
jgi:hypothetical protein